MLFGNHAIDKTVDEHVREIAILANAPDTLIFLDTNILSYLYKLHNAARSEFFAWSDKVVTENRLIVPAWAASEYLSRVTSKTLDSYTPKGKEANQATKLLNGLFETASLFVDDTSLKRIGYDGDRATFISSFRSAIDALTPFTRVFSQDFDSGVVHQQIESHLSAAILDSDLAALCIRATQEGGGRFEHRLPPGFRDADKPENRLGDLIIWFEILGKSASSAESFPKVLFISRDEKNDWVYAPKMRAELTQSGRKLVGNSRPEIKLADPRLVTEFRRIAGHPNITITSIDTLVEGLSKAAPSQFTHLATAIQINIEQSTATAPTVNGPEVPVNDSGDDAPIASNTSPVEAEAEQPAGLPPTIDPLIHTKVPAADFLTATPAPRLQYDLVALRDREYQADAPSGINEIIRDLKSLNWYTQNPAITKIRSIRQDTFTPSSWFVLGRNVYQAACGNSQKAMEFMAGLETQLRQFPPETAQHILAGILFEVYFDSYGNFREEAKFGYADKPLSLVVKDEFSDVVDFINYHLHSYTKQLVFKPGDHTQKTIQITSLRVDPDAPAPEGVDSEPLGYEISSIKLDGVELIRLAPPEEPHPFFGAPSRSKVSLERIRDQISNELAIPKWALTIDCNPQITTNDNLVMAAEIEFAPKLALSS